MTNDIPDEGVLRQQVDRRQLQEIIAGLDEGVLLIDPADGIVWANKRGLELHDAVDIADLGGSAEGYRERFILKYRNNHALNAAQYPIDRLLAGDIFQDIVVNVRKIGKTPDDSWHSIHQLRGISLTNAAGQPESFVLIITDMTERFTAEERFERTFAANPAPAVICRLSDFRYVKVNQGFLEMTGYSRDEVISHTTYEVDVLANAATRESAIAALREGHTIAQTEATLRLPGGGSKLVIVAGQPIEIGDELCMLFTFMDMEPRKKAEDALRQSEERFARSFRMTPVPTFLCTRHRMRVLDVNEAFMAVLGYTEEETVGHVASELAIWVDPVVRRQFEQQIEQRGTLRNFELQLRTKREDLLDCLLSAETVSIQDQECVLTVIQDITDRKRSESELIMAIEAVMQDTSWFSRTVIEKLANLRHPERSKSITRGLADLSDREIDVLGLICQGLSDGEIVKKLGLKRNTVRNHIARIYSKIAVHSRAAAIVWARERGFTGGPVKKLSLHRSRGGH